MTTAVTLDYILLGRFLATAAERLEEMRAELSALDGEVGDGDHGASMADGFRAASLGFAKAGGEDVPAALRAAGESFLQSVGATVGPLYATAFVEAAKRVEDGRIGLADLLSAFNDGIVRRGNAAPGDCTMIDVWDPAARAARDAGAGSIGAALDAGRAGLEATRTMIASRGRAARLGSRTLGQLDPGASSAVVILSALAEVLGEPEARG
ncbi:dihydroxyacetone kinase subunit DhaL [Tropicimonas sp. IMCC34043]|uniref:dihydroxyacetone kinase subunit DhaL n=1 Tax=Tropicimonas sp. IMCC34043 TaxID=2248760 RepID=UPI00130095BC|nr:dihydroxyacetone kinase subunit DhaL [Tropicimonas sp. IMCC34043]